MKLVLIALALTAVAFGAPRTNFLENDSVVTESLLQVGLASNVAELKRQYHELEVQLKDGAEVTPGVKATIDKMIDMVTTQIEPAIDNAHEADQTVLNTKMSAIAQLNSEMETTVKMLNDEADVVRGLIDDQQKSAKEWDDAATLFTTTQNNYLHVYDDQRNRCCQHQNSAVLDVRYTPAYVECDYTIPAGATCSARARKAVKQIVYTHFTDGLALYKKLTGECTSLTTDLGSADTDTTTKIEACQKEKREEEADQTMAIQEEKRVQAAWDQAISFYNTNYTVMFTSYTTSKTKVQSDEKDRNSEWAAVQEIKCMLNSYAAGKPLDQATNAECKASISVADILNIGYPVEIPQMTPVLAPFEDHYDTSTFENVCDARTAAPVYTCVVRDPNPQPVCSPHELA